jgi:hypothetical protein
MYMRLFAAAVVAAAASSYLYVRLHRIQTATLRQAEGLTRELGRAAGSLSRFILTAADFFAALAALTNGDLPARPNLARASWTVTGGTTRRSSGGEYDPTDDEDDLPDCDDR